MNPTASAAAPGTTHPTPTPSQSAVASASPWAPGAPKGLQGSGFRVEEGKDQGSNGSCLNPQPRTPNPPPAEIRPTPFRASEETKKQLAAVGEVKPLSYWQAQAQKDGERGKGREKDKKAAAPLTLDAIAAKWRTAELRRTSDVLRLGAMSARFIAQQLRGVRHPGERRELRAKLIQQIRDRLEADGLAGPSADVNRYILCHAAGLLLQDHGDPRKLTVQALRALVPLVRRDSKSGRYYVPVPIQTKVYALFRRAIAEKLSGATIAEEVRAILGKPKVQRSEGDPAERALRAIRRLDDRAALRKIIEAATLRLQSLSAKAA